MKIKEYDDNPSTNRTHVINALGCIDNIIESYDAGGFNAIRKDVLEELGNATWYRFMNNRIPRRDLDIFADKFEGQAFFTQTDYYRRAEGFRQNAYMYKRLCELMVRLYEDVYIKENTKDMIYLYKFIANELEQAASENAEEEFSGPIMFNFVHDVIDVLVRIIKNNSEVTITGTIKTKADELDKEFNTTFIVSGDSRGTRYNYTSIFNNRSFIDSEEVINLRNHMKELAQLVLEYGLAISK